MNLYMGILEMVVDHIFEAIEMQFLIAGDRCSVNPKINMVAIIARPHLAHDVLITHRLDEGTSHILCG